MRQLQGGAEPGVHPHQGQPGPLSGTAVEGAFKGVILRVAAALGHEWRYGPRWRRVQLRRDGAHGGPRSAGVNLHFKAVATTDFVRYTTRCSNRLPARTR
jgi:hypothetical protein